MRRFLSIGILGVTVAYLALVVSLELFSPVECLDEPCSSEGVDNTVVSWGTDYFLSLALFGFAIHLCLADKQRAVRLSGILAQIFMGGSFVLDGINHWMYANNGVNDGYGMAPFWLIALVSSVFFTCSGMSHAYFAKETTNQLSKLLKSCCCPDWFLVIYQICLVLSCTGNMVGCLWCVLSPKLHVDSVIDEIDELALDEEHPLPVCIRIVTISQVSLYLSYALLWIPAGLLLKAAARQNPKQILGLSTPFAAGSIVLLQWTVGAMYFVCLMFASWVRNGAGNAFDYNEFMELFQKTYGTQVMHYGMLMTFYCSHNLSWTLTAPSTQGKVVESGQKRGRRRKVGFVTASPLSSEVGKAEEGVLSKKKSPTRVNFAEPEK